MSEARVTHVGFSDESHWNTGRFRSLGLVTTPLGVALELEEKLRGILEKSGVPEFKWKKLDGAKERFAAIAMCDFAVNVACQGVLRVDVLVWDILDRRHSVRGRDDIANLQRMYYHLFRNVLRVRWPNDAVWRLHPDEHTAMDWDTIKDCLESVSEGIEVEHSLLTKGKIYIIFRRDFGLEEICPVSSKYHPLLQLADLFAGMAVFSREKFEAYQAWLHKNNAQAQLFHCNDSPVSFSRREHERFQVLHAFDRMCKNRKLGVSLTTNRGLRTPNPKNPLNFWLYEVQHPWDKAPTRE